MEQIIIVQKPPNVRDSPKALHFVSLVIVVLFVGRADWLLATSATMSVVTPGWVTDLTRVETRVSIRNTLDSPQSYTLELSRHSSLGAEAIATTNIIVPARGQRLYTRWILTEGHAGLNTVRYQITPSAGPKLTGKSSFQVAASDSRTVPLLTTAWIDPGAVLPGVYPQNHAVTEQDVRDSINAANDVGVQTLIITYSEYLLNGWGTFYPSQHYASTASFDVVGTILNQASKNGQKVFVGLGRGNDLLLTWNGFDDPDRVAEGLNHGTRVASELWGLYHHEPSFFRLVFDSRSE